MPLAEKQRFNNWSITILQRNRREHGYKRLNDVIYSGKKKKKKKKKKKTLLKIGSKVKFPLKFKFQNKNKNFFIYLFRKCIDHEIIKAKVLKLAFEKCRIGVRLLRDDKE